MDKTKGDMDSKNHEILRKAEAESNNFKILFDYAPQGMLTVNKDYKIINMNTAAAEIFSISAKDSIGKTIGESFGCINYNGLKEGCSQSKDCHVCVFRNAVDNVLFNKITLNGIEFLFDCGEKDNYNSQIWLKLSAVPMTFNDSLHALLVIEDVTLNRELAKNLIRNERRLRLITDNMIDTITQIDHSGQIEFVTPSCWSLLGYSPDEIVGKSFKNFVYPEDLKMVEELFHKRFKTRENFSSRLRLVRTDGKVIWIEANGSVVDDENRRRTIVYVLRDVTEEERYKAELEKSKEEAISASQSKSQFLANMSHEIRTPMNGIIGMTNITLMDNLTEEQRENMTMVKNSAISLLGIINSILDFSKIEAGKIEIEKIEFDIKELVSKVVNPLTISADQKKIDVEVNYDLHTDSKFIGDPVRISQILNNLIYNAIKFTEKGGVYITFKTLEKNNKSVELSCSVRDTGIGIDLEDQNTLFESFHQVDGSITRRYGGTGLGLSITKGLLDLMGGSLKVESELGKGSTFYFSIPLKISTIHKVISHDQVSIQLPSADKGLRILLVEDDLINRKMTSKILQNQNHEVVLAENGREAVDVFSKSSFDLILMDIQMPEMDGVSASKLIKKISKSRGVYTPIIALTAYAIEGDEERFIAEGMDDYISKPIELNNFFDVILRNINREDGVKSEVTDEIKGILERVAKDISAPNRKSLSVDESDKAFIKRILKFFNIIDQALRERDFESIESAAHRLKTIFSEAGYVEARQMIFKLELSARKSDIEKIIDDYNRVKQFFNFDE